VVDLKLGVLHPVQQHVHARQVVGGDVLLLPVDFADAVIAPICWRTLSSSEPEPQAKSSTLFSLLLFAGGRFLAVERDDAREDGRDRLRGVELAGLFAGTGGKLADQVFVGVAEDIAVGGELRDSLGDLGDDGAELFVAVGRGAPSFSELRLISENSP
jgi:hypothetical protein